MKEGSTRCLFHTFEKVKLTVELLSHHFTVKNASIGGHLGSGTISNYLLESSPMRNELP